MVSVVGREARSRAIAGLELVREETTGKEYNVAFVATECGSNPPPVGDVACRVG